MPKTKTETTDKKKVKRPTGTRWFKTVDELAEAHEELVQRVVRLGPRALRKQK